MLSPAAALGDGTCPRVMLQRLARCEYPQGCVAGGDAELERGLVDGRRQRVVRELRQRCALTLQNFEGAAVEYSSSGCARLRVRNFADLVMGEQIGRAACRERV